MHIGAIGYLGCRHNGIVIIGFIPQAYQHSVLSIWVAGILVQRLSSLQIVGIQARLFIIIVGIAALSVCQWYVVVQCQRRLSSVGGLVRSLIGSGSYIYRYKACRVVGHISCNSYQARSCRRYQVEDGKCVSIIDAYQRCRRVLALQIYISRS